MKKVLSIALILVMVLALFAGCGNTAKQEEAAAKTIYGRNFARIRHLEQFADTVGTLIQNQIRSF